MIIIEILIFLSTVLPLFHLLNALLTRRRRTVGTPCSERAMSILIPCYNEEDTIAMSIRGLLAMDYTNYQVIYINDGSHDGTMNVLNKALGLVCADMSPCVEDKRAYALFNQKTRRLGIEAVYRSHRYPNFLVIEKKNGGKSESLNAGIHYAENDLIVTLDADSVLDRQALVRMSRVFEDENVVACGGSIHIMQGYDPAYLEKRIGAKRRGLITMQILEYLKGFYIYKLSLAKQKALAIISGAFGVFTKDILKSVGGFRKTLGEDIDITLKIQVMIHKTAKKIVYLPDALCYTQCPESWHDLVRQRIRWQKGFINCITYHKWFLLKTFLTKSLSFHFLVEALVVGLVSCLFTVFTYAFVGILAFGDVQTITVFAIYFGFGVVFNVLYALAAVAVSVRHNKYPRAILKKTVAAMLLDIMFYRFFNLAMYLGGTVSYFWRHSSDHRWNKVARSKRVFSIGRI
jgi:cellulose synthase/poly-beta-1,6-N-acetylglucosamine synthase-like glycosyltransferase